MSLLIGLIKNNSTWIEILSVKWSNLNFKNGLDLFNFIKISIELFGISLLRDWFFSKETNENLAEDHSMYVYYICIISYMYLFPLWGGIK